MTLKLSLFYGKQHATLSVYATTMNNPEEIKDRFYEDLQNVISSIPKADELIVLGDIT